MSPNGGLNEVTNHPPGQNDRHFADGRFKCIFMNENFFTLIRISLKFAPKRPIDNEPALVQVMAWCQTGNEPITEPMW